MVGVQGAMCRLLAFGKQQYNTLAKIKELVPLKVLFHFSSVILDPSWELTANHDQKQWPPQADKYKTSPT